MKEKKLLTEIMHQFIGNKQPIKVSEPVLRSSVSRWELTPEKTLQKTYEFLSLEERNAFIYTLLQQDEQIGVRPSKTTIDGLMVKVELGTKSGLLIDLDKQRAKMMDSLWKDVVYSIGGRKF